MADQPDFSRIKGNVRKMLDQSAPESDIDAYLATENVTPEQLRSSPEKGAARRFVEAMPSGAVKGFTEGMSLLTAATQPIQAITRGAALYAAGKEPTEGQFKGVGDMAQEYLPKPEGAAGRYGALTGEVLANPVTYAGPGSAALKVGSAAMGAAGSEAAGTLFEGSKFEAPARFVGGLAGGGVVGGVAAGKKAAEASAILPKIEEIKQSGSQSYKAIKDARLQIKSGATEDFANELRGELDKNLIVESGAPSSFRGVAQIEKSNGNIAQLMDTYSALGEIPPTAGADYVAAQKIRGALGSFIDKLTPDQVLSGDPQFTKTMWDHAKAQWRAYKELDLIEKGREVAEHRANVSGTGFNTINTLRQEIRKILDSEKKSRGFSNEAKQKMEEIVEGTWATNAARYVSKFAPSGAVSGMFTVLTDLTAGLGTAATVGAAGLISKYLGVYLTKRQIKDLEDLIRMEAPTGKARAAEYQAARPEEGLVTGAAVRGALTSPLAQP